ncbi:MAG: peptidoglycan editing factor PgeF [Sulfuriferula multivorans]|uniref:Purine nucleoside phosphorylase n=1 Tax=Sulfuriferula multivorans TaxID=1559896 RepID=A0A7C9K226_9PROT|nr:peptidoglycan editing factor PgeF [Sulfuriferula multivorans]
MTTREGGVSCPPWDSFNLGDHVGDDAAHVAENRARLRVHLPAEPAWLKQIHGATVVDVSSDELTADASITRQAGCICAVLTADCLPVLFCDRAGRVVAAAHAGWRGLAQGVLEATVAAMQVPPSDVLAWMGAAIGPDAFEVGDDVRQAFVKQHPEAAAAFVPHPSGVPGKWLADIYQLARNRLNHAGVQAIYGGGRCTYNEAGDFYSYRREGVTGRMASLIWLG